MPKYQCLQNILINTDYQYMMELITNSKTCLKRSLKNRGKQMLKTHVSLMKAESIA